MTVIKSIESWNAPKWHQDFGDPNLELNILKEACLKLFELEPMLEFELDCYEEGYMNVNVLLRSNEFFEVHVIDKDEKRVGLYFNNGDEVFVDVKGIIDLALPEG